MNRPRLYMLACGGIVAVCAVIFIRPVKNQDSISLTSPEFALSRAISTEPAYAQRTGPPNIRSDLFTSPGLPVARPITKSAVITPAAEPAQPPDPLAGYQYTGSVSIAGVTYGLIEDRTTREGRFVKAGDGFQGASVLSIERERIRLSLAGVDRTMPLRDDYSMIPLDKTSHPDVRSVGFNAESDGSADLPVALGTRFAIVDWITDADIEKVKDDAFEGRISTDELIERTRGHQGLAVKIEAYDLEITSQLFLSVRQRKPPE